MALSERYKKALVTVAMGLRTEEDIKNNGLIRFCKNEKEKLVNYATTLFNKRQNLLALKIKKTGFRSEHINITNKTEFYDFITNLNNIFSYENEVWIVSSSALECWRCRIYLSTSLDCPDLFEMAFSNDDHILDHLNNDNKNQVKYVSYAQNLITNKFELVESHADPETLSECSLILFKVLTKYKDNFKNIKIDMQLLNINGISLDCRVNNGYDFHDFDVSYEEVKKVIDFYIPMYLSNKK